MSQEMVQRAKSTEYAPFEILPVEIIEVIISKLEYTPGVLRPLYSVNRRFRGILQVNERALALAIGFQQFKSVAAVSFGSSLKPGFEWLDGVYRKSIVLGRILQAAAAAPLSDFVNLTSVELASGLYSVPLLGLMRVGLLLLFHVQAPLSQSMFLPVCSVLHDLPMKLQALLFVTCALAAQVAAHYNALPIDPNDPLLAISESDNKTERTLWDFQAMLLMNGPEHLLRILKGMKRLSWSTTQPSAFEQNIGVHSQPGWKVRYLKHLREAVNNFIHWTGCKEDEYQDTAWDIVDRNMKEHELVALLRGLPTCSPRCTGTPNDGREAMETAMDKENIAPRL